MFKVSSSRFVIAVVLIFALPLLSLSAVSAQPGDPIPTESISFNYAQMELIIPDMGIRSFSNIVVGPSDTPNGITISFDMTITRPNGERTTQSIIAILIGLLVDHRVTYTLENVLITGYSDTVPTSAQNMLRRAIVRSLTQYIRGQIGSGHVITDFQVTGEGITISYR